MTDPRLRAVDSEKDIDAAWRETPIGDLLRYHNLGIKPKAYERAELLIAMCMDNRKTLRLPDNFAYILRAGAGNLRRMQFKFSFAIAVGEVKAIAIIGHSDCGMNQLSERRSQFIAGLIQNGGWDAAAAARHFDEHVGEFQIVDTIAFAEDEAARLRQVYPRITVAPLFFTVEDGRLHQLSNRALTDQGRLEETRRL